MSPGGEWAVAPAHQWAPDGWLLRPAWRWPAVLSSTRPAGGQSQAACHRIAPCKVMMLAKSAAFWAAPGRPRATRFVPCQHGQPSADQCAHTRPPVQGQTNARVPRVLSVLHQAAVIFFHAILPSQAADNAAHGPQGRSFNKITATRSPVPGCLEDEQWITLRSSAGQESTPSG